MKSPFQQPIAFRPALQESDELIQAINDAPIRQDDEWQLHDDPDPEKLNRFLDEALREFNAEDGRE